MSVEEATEVLLAHPDRVATWLQFASSKERRALDERAEVLAEFWDMIDTEIANGERIPPWE